MDVHVVEDRISTTWTLIEPDWYDAVVATDGAFEMGEVTSRCHAFVGACKYELTSVVRWSSLAAACHAHAMLSICFVRSHRARAYKISTGPTEVCEC